MKEMSALVVSDSGNIYVADKTILVFNSGGQFCQEFGAAQSGSKGRYTGLALSTDGHLLAARTEKAGGVLKVRLGRKSDQITK